MSNKLKTLCAITAAIGLAGCSNEYSAQSGQESLPNYMIDSIVKETLSKKHSTIQTPEGVKHEYSRKTQEGMLIVNFTVPTNQSENKYTGLIAMIRPETNYDGFPNTCFQRDTDLSKPQVCGIFGESNVPYDSVAKIYEKMSTPIGTGINYK